MQQKYPSALLGFVMMMGLAVPSHGATADWGGAYAGGGLSLSYAAPAMDMSLYVPGNAYVAGMDEKGRQHPPAFGPGLGLDTGFNLQSGSWVLGCEAGADYLDLQGLQSDTFVDVGPTVTIRQSYHVGWEGTLRPRIGFAFGDGDLLDLSAGLALATVSTESASTDNFGDKLYGRGDFLALGWCAGLGYARQCGPRWSWRLDYLFSDYSPLASGESGGTLAGRPVFLLYLQTNTLRLGVDRRF
jgi:high affinity Mn2+ porin